MNYKKFPFLLSIFTMVGGVYIAIMFGINEDTFKNKIARDLLKNEKIMKIEDTARREKKIESEKKKNWRYYQRFHFHATAIGSMSLAILVFLNFVAAPQNLVTVTSYFISVGGFLYPFVWLFAAIYGPIMGRSEAKEAFAFFGYGGGLFLVGLILLKFLIIKYPVEIKRKL